MSCQVGRYFLALALIRIKIALPWFLARPAGDPERRWGLPGDPEEAERPPLGPCPHLQDLRGFLVGVRMRDPPPARLRHLSEQKEGSQPRGAQPGRWCQGLGGWGTEKPEGRAGDTVKAVSSLPPSAQGLSTQTGGRCHCHPKGNTASVIPSTSQLTQSSAGWVCHCWVWAGTLYPVLEQVGDRGGLSALPTSSWNCVSIE